MVAIFHDLLYDCFEDYVNDIVMNSPKVSLHIDDMRSLFEYIRHNLRMNPLKYTFGVSSGKLLGFLEYFKGIDFNLTKAKAIQDMEPLKTGKLNS